MGWTEMLIMSGTLVFAGLPLMILGFFIAWVEHKLTSK